jgi:hypothetical protein
VKPPPAMQAAAGQGEDRGAGRAGAGPLQDGQALPPRDHRQLLRLRARPGADRGRGQARRRSASSATTVPEVEMPAEAAVGAYKNLSQVERAFRSYKTDLDVRPLHHHTEPRVAPTSSSASSPTTSSGTCDVPSLHCSSRTTTAQRPPSSAPASSQRRRSRRRPGRRRRAGKPTKACRCTASAPSWPRSPRRAGSGCVSKSSPSTSLLP